MDIFFSKNKIFSNVTLFFATKKTHLNRYFFISTWDIVHYFILLSTGILFPNKIHFYLTIPKITSGAMAISVTAQRLAPTCMKCQIWHFKLLCFSFVKFLYARLRFELIRVFRLSPCKFIEKL